MNGVLVLDKPPRMSSAMAVDHVKKRLGVKRAGHGGTLDPIATGVLAICLGEATKLAEYGWSGTMLGFFDVLRAQVGAHTARVRALAAAGDPLFARLARQGVADNLDIALTELDQINP